MMKFSSTKREIAEAAALEFIAKGYAGASLSGIADRLGLTKGALVYHFPMKADFATHFIKVVREATTQAYEFGRQEYPDSATRSLLLSFLVMGEWRRLEPQVAAGFSLFLDRASPAFEANDAILDWLHISLEAFELARERGQLAGTLSAREAAEVFVVTGLGSVFFGAQVRMNLPKPKRMHFIRLALMAAGDPDADAQAEEVGSIYYDNVPPLNSPTALGAV